MESGRTKEQSKTANLYKQWKKKKKMIIVKTNMTKIPNSCKECEYSIINYGLIGCPFLRNWLEGWQIKEGQTKLNDCPLEQK